MKSQTSLSLTVSSCPNGTLKTAKGKMMRKHNFEIGKSVWLVIYSCSRC